MNENVLCDAINDIRTLIDAINGYNSVILVDRGAGNRDHKFVTLNCSHTT